MLVVYILSALAGGILVAASALLGGGDHDTHFGDTDFQGIDGHDGVHSDVYLPFLSLRFWTYFAACFGITGWLLTAFTSTGPTMVAIIAAATGFIAGFATHVVMRLFKQGEADSGILVEHLVGKEGRVLVGISDGHEGKIRIEVKGELVDILAFTEEDVQLKPGDSALVVAIENGRANVVSYTAMLEEQNT